MKKLTLIALLAGLAWWTLGPPDTEAVVLPDGSLTYPGYVFTNPESFSLEARVLSREDYRFGREAELSPTDLALGWGPMTNDDVVDQIEVSQGNRWYHWRTERYPIPRADIESHSANVHLVPATEQASADLSRVRKDDRIRLEGRLVDVVADDGWRWRSSRSRTDTGNGACELMLLERIVWI
jgi:hypothetical protein